MKTPSAATLRLPLLAGALATLSLAAPAATLDVVVPATAPVVGETFQVLLSGSGFEAIVGGGLDLSFASAQFELLSVSFDPAWNFRTSAGDIDNGSGTVSDMSFNLWGSMAGNFPIATLEFLATGAGLGQISSSASELFPFATVAAEVLPVSFGGAELEVLAVPEPQTWALMGAGLLLMASAISRQRNVT